MTTPLDDLERDLLITADSQAGPSPEGHGPDLEKKWIGDFEGWLEESEGPAEARKCPAFSETDLVPVVAPA